MACGVILVVLLFGRARMVHKAGARKEPPPAAEATPAPSIASTPAKAAIPQTNATLTFQVPPEGTDYDSVEFALVKPLEDETPGAMELKEAVMPATKDTTFTLPTGYYRVTLKSSTPARVRDFVAASALPVRPGKAPASFPLPGSMSRKYVGYVGARRGPPGETPVAVFCAVQVEIRSGTGEILIVFDEPKAPLEMDYAAMKPRPDNAWPISNVFLEDPARLSFDCALSHVDHRVVIDRSDGVTTLLALPVPPEDDRQLGALLQRMRDLLKAQAKTAAAKPERFNARYRGLAAERLPNNEHMKTLETFRAYVNRVTSGQPQSVAMGDRLRILKSGSDGWEVKALRSGEER